MGEAIPTGVKRRPLLDAFAPRADLFHGLNQRLPQRLRSPAVVTFHDLFVITAEYSTPEFRRRFEEQARHAAARAERIICVSRFTANQVRDLLRVEESRLDVIHHGVRFPPASETCRERIILSVGALQHRKNTARLIEAFESTPPGWRLVLAGSQGFGAAEILEKAARSRRASDIELPGWIGDRELASFYSRASIFAFPSLDEGFGIPILEAMAHGLPVVTSNVSAMPEVAGDAAWLVDPTDAAQIAAALRTLAEDEGLRTSLSAKGRARAAGFTWEKAVEATRAVYSRVIG
ncbi:MAG: glycosyltransferase family 1 protein [Bryobacteraceae bacterium]